MNKRFLKNWVLCLTLTVTTLSWTIAPPAKAWADGTGPNFNEMISQANASAEIDVAGRLENASDADVDNAVTQVTTQLNAAATTEAQKSFAQSATATLNQDRDKPGFKQRLIQFMKNTRHVGSKAGVVVFTATGVAGGAVLATSLAPLVIGANLVASLASGKGAFATHENDKGADLDGNQSQVEAGEVVGAVGEVYAMVAVYAVVGIAFPWAWVAAVLERAVQLAICSGQIQDMGTHRATYCKYSELTYNHILFAEAVTGDVIGRGIREAFIIPAHLIGRIFHHSKKGQASQDDSDVGTPAPEAN